MEVIKNPPQMNIIPINELFYYLKIIHNKNNNIKYQKK